MTVSVLDLFTVGIGPSSSHTVGPMRAAYRFATRLSDEALLEETASVRCELHGSLGATGLGHGSVPAVVLGLAGEQPHLVDPAVIDPAVELVRATGRLLLGGKREIGFVVDRDVVLRGDVRLPHHSNGLRFTATDAAGAVLARRDYFSVGGGTVLDEDEVTTTTAPDPGPDVHPFPTADALLAATRATGLSISGVVLANERARHGEDATRAHLLAVRSAMRGCIARGTTTEGVLPGGLRVRRRAAALRRRLEEEAPPADPRHAMEWVTLDALAVNEENAAGGRVVTAPTNGAAGIVPAVLHHAARVVPGFAADPDDHAVRFLLTAGAIGLLLKRNASISGAEVGCQGEVGSACSMAAAGLAELLGGTPEQVENAAEIGIEHHLGLTCDPVGGLVQIPCIERNGVAAVTAITAARMALRGDGTHRVSLDTAIRTMRATGADMSTKYKETARGGLALTVVAC
ncbi:L-serine ammonia-lyase [Actinomycetospora sp. TBRC 11914]|uniref:L-serine ammonia-lyase n=1 Tax=Actinomycetospora sp. TBRC 11914 TaxID=2729387 RepID=UPI00145ED78D|nr:L-serine ammonia-lyase [Actinomycetospora sp. TBRC 11914]NMO88524.1 L-serine ammonia-lyase [Actinomycetospora sp. TBRC 11914]